MKPNPHSNTGSFAAMARVAIAMMVHSRLKTLGTLIGVVFAVVLSGQALGTLSGLIFKNLMYVRHAGADIWMTPPATQTLQAGKNINLASLMTARTTPGVAWADPLLFGGAVVSLPTGGTEPVTVVGVGSDRHGGPWNMVQGTPDVLEQPDTMIFEDSERETLGGLNTGSVQEVNGRRAVAGGFTWGLVPFGPSYAFADYDFARLLLHTQRDQASFVLVGVAPGHDPVAVAKELAARAPETKVMTQSEFEASIVRYLLVSTPIGMTLGVSTIFGVLVGFIIVTLSMFSAVVDNLREFGTLKAMGATTSDLTKLLLVQSVVFALAGSVIGLGLTTTIAGALRSAKLTILQTPELMAGTVVVMMLLCIVASSLSLLRLARLEPAMVFK